jgi:hypothetical protein
MTAWPANTETTFAFTERELLAMQFLAAKG